MERVNLGATVLGLRVFDQEEAGRAKPGEQIGFGSEETKKRARRASQTTTTQEGSKQKTLER